MVDGNQLSGKQALLLEEISILRNLSDEEKFELSLSELSEEEKFVFIISHPEYSIRTMARTLGVSHNRYNYWKMYNNEILEYRNAIQKIVDNNYGKIGVNGVCEILRARGLTGSKAKIKKIMEELGLETQPPRSYFTECESEEIEI